MKLHTFPVVVQKEIFKMMELIELVLLSYCSQRAKCSILQFRQPLFKTVTSLCYATYNQDNCIVKMRRASNDWMHLFSLASDEEYEKIFGSCTTELIRLDLFGKYVLCRTNWNSCLNIKIDQSMSNSLLQTLHCYLYKLFGNFTEYQVSAECNGFMPMLRHINSTYISLNYCPNQSILENFISTSPNQKYVQFVTNLKNNLSPNSKFYQVKNLYDYRPGQCDDDFLLHFKGRTLFLEQTKVHLSKVIQFVKMWQSNEEYHHLEFLSIELFRHAYTDVETTLEQLGVKKTDVSREPPAYQIMKREYMHSDGQIPISLPSRHYVVNEVSGHVATLSIGREHFKFAVWRISEEEFLETSSSMRKMDSAAVDSN